MTYRFEIRGNNPEDQGSEFLRKHIPIKHLLHPSIKTTHPRIDNLTILFLFFIRLRQYLARELPPRNLVSSREPVDFHSSPVQTIRGIPEHNTAYTPYTPPTDHDTPPTATYHKNATIHTPHMSSPNVSPYTSASQNACDNLSSTRISGTTLHNSIVLTACTNVSYDTLCFDFGANIQ